jgi:rhamnose utilization protein RhaD (predicted bifunctional aldolase and dehydrogenase)/NAD(P)-dependent dehydrogenase (short-subunit alcohol dehydrogenase family)
MRNLWSDRDARAAVRRYARDGIGADLALRIYTTRLLGGEPRLVQHGGGNTSVKTVVRDKLGDKAEVLCVKGSGADMAAIDAAGLPAVRLAPLRKLAAREALSDEDMVAILRASLIDAAAPTPSVETLLHAFLPHKFVDHTHANAIVALTDRPDGMALCRKVFGDRVAIVPYVMPGFALAKRAKQVFDAHPGCEGLILHKHGLFTFGATARESYARTIALVSRAERTLNRTRRKPPRGKLPKALASSADIAPILRGLAALPLARDEGRFTRFVLDHRGGPRVLDYVNGRELRRYSQRGPVTPDHAIRTKPKPLVLPAPEAGKPGRFAAAAGRAMAKYQADYRAYVARHNAKARPKRTPLDPSPRVILVPGVGLFGLGTTAKDAAIAADIAETTAAVVMDVEARGRFESIPERDQFEIEYWPLEQAKLAGRAVKPLQGQVAVVTGGAGTIGLATAAALRKEGAEIALLDIAGAEAAAAEVGGLGLACDVTDRRAVDAAFRRIAARFGGLDILVSNAGAAWQGAIGEVGDDILRKSFELNFFAHQNVAQAALKIMRAQGTGGALLFNASKQAVNPGPDLGPYGLPKAATLALMRQYAVDYGREGITANAVNADRIRSGLLTAGFVAERARARGVSARTYMAGNLLGREVTAQDVADVFVALARSRKTTGAVLTVDGGNIAAALR